MKHIKQVRVKTPKVPSPKVKPKRIERPDTRISEAEMQVELTKMVGGVPQTIMKKVTAATPDDAIRKAKQGIPDAALYTQIKTTNITASTGQSNPQSQSQPNQQKGQDQEEYQTSQSGNVQLQQVGTQNQQQTSRPFPESIDLAKIDYPYSIMLPESYERVIPVIMEGITRVKRFGRVYVEILNDSAMKTFVQGLNKNKDKRAGIIIEGIVGSIR